MNAAGACAGYDRLVIRSTARLREFERWYTRTHVAPLSYAEALRTFGAMWRHAQALDPTFPTEDWRADVEADIELARVLNGLPRGA